MSVQDTLPSPLFWHETNLKLSNALLCCNLTKQEVSKRLSETSKRGYYNRPWAALQNWRELWERSLQYACSPQTWPGDSSHEDSDSVRSVTETHEVATPANACVSRNPRVLDACWRKETKVSTQDKYDISCWTKSLETLKLSVSKIPFQAVSHVTPAAKSLFVESNDWPYGPPGKILIDWLGKMGGNSKAWPWCQWLEFEWLVFEWLPQWRLS